MTLGFIVGKFYPPHRGRKHLVDSARRQVLEPCVRAYFVRRVVLIGAESTGKTTLAQFLARHFHTEWVAEYGREHWERKVAGLTMDNPLPAWTPEEFVHIAREQQSREDTLAGVRQPGAVLRYQRLRHRHLVRAVTILINKTEAV